MTAGIDWANNDHVVVILDGQGRRIARSQLAHSKPGLRSLVTLLARHRVGEVAIERGDGPVVDAVRAAGLTVVVIHPNQVKHLRSRYGSVGNKDDRLDAYVLADTLRTDRHRYQPWLLDTDATVALRRLSRARRALVDQRVALTNQLREHLRTALPGAVGLFHHLDSTISLKFLARYSTQARADWLSPARLEQWLRTAGYTGRTPAVDLHTRLATAPEGAYGDLGDTLAHITKAWVDLLTTLKNQIAALTRQVEQHLHNHPDQEIFTSLPRAGRVRAASLLAEIGDSRGRFPTPDALAGLAGVTPSTRQSGKTHTVSFRWACDKRLRHALTEFADNSRHLNPWAAHLYQQAIDRKHSHNHAIRILARAWITIIWRCWQNRTRYNPDQHQALQTLLAAQG